jgi:hypothetical protein
MASYDSSQEEGRQEALRQTQQEGPVQGHPDLQARAWLRHQAAREGREAFKAHELSADGPKPHWPF